MLINTLQYQQSAAPDRLTQSLHCAILMYHNSYCILCICTRNSQHIFKLLYVVFADPTSELSEEPRKPSPDGKYYMIAFYFAYVRVYISGLYGSQK